MPEIFQNSIRNFAIIAHIDHGKSTLADRLLEITDTIEKRKMREQYLDMHPLERERGITIKMQPVQMVYKIRNSKLEIADSEFILNLIDTPGHIDFNYEVSRALAAVEGAVLLVDATQGTQAQTLTNLELARKQSLAIIPALNKIDKADEVQITNAKKELASLGFSENEILAISAKTGEGVPELLEAIIKKIPPPSSESNFPLQALVFDYEYSDHRGLISYIRIKRGAIKTGAALHFLNAQEKFIVQELGVFKPELRPKEALQAGEIGYLITSIKELKNFRVGETIADRNNLADVVAGYKPPKPVIFSNIYPRDASRFEELRASIAKLWLMDNSFSYEAESNPILGRGFKTGFLGKLHLEIIAERLRRDFHQELVITEPSVVFEVARKNGKTEKIYSAASFPENYEIVSVKEPFIEIEIISPNRYLQSVLHLIQNFKGEIGEVSDFSSSRLKIKGKMALREFAKNFYDKLKSVTSGFASLSYISIGERQNELLRLDLLINGETMTPFSKVVLRGEEQEEARAIVEKLAENLPRQIFEQRIQASVNNRVLASHKISALKKDVTGYLYGGDRTRKMKLWQKQKRGKKKLFSRSKINIPHEVFLKMLK